MTGRELGSFDGRWIGGGGDGDGFRVVEFFDCKWGKGEKGSRGFIVLVWVLESCLGVRVWAAYAAK